MKKIKYGLLSILFVSLIGLTLGCASLSSGKESPIVLSDGGWDSNRFHNEIASIIIEEGYGYETEEIAGSAAARMTGLEDGDIDVFMELWSENTGEPYYEALENGTYVKLSVNYGDNF